MSASVPNIRPLSIFKNINAATWLPCMSCISGMQSNPSWSISVKVTSPEPLKESASANCQAGWHWRERKPLSITVSCIHWGVFSSAVVLTMACIKVQSIKVKGASWICKRYGLLRRTRSGLHWVTAPTGGVLQVWCDHQCQAVLPVALLIARATLFIQVPSSCSVNFVGASWNLSPAQTPGTLTPDSSGSIHSKCLRRSSLMCWRKKQINKLMKNGSLIAYKFPTEQTIEMGGLEFLPRDLGCIQMWYEWWCVRFVLKKSCKFHIMIFVIVTDHINKKKGLLLIWAHESHDHRSWYWLRSLIVRQCHVRITVEIIEKTETSAVEESGCRVDALHVLNYLV